MSYQTPSNSMNTMQRLKQQTQSYHTALEQKLDWRQWVLSDYAYRQLLQRFYGFYLPLEAGLGRLSWSSLPFDFEARRKTELLAQDLQFLGDTPDSLAGLPLCHNLPSLTDFPQALGCLYVLEGSTLGGKIIFRFLQQPLNLSKIDGGSFFSCYGDEVGPMWIAFSQTVNAFTAGQREREAALTAAACDTFQKIDEWLRPIYKT